MSDIYRFDDRPLVVTGGATGVGAALLADLGATAVTNLDHGFTASMTTGQLDFTELGL